MPNPQIVFITGPTGAGKSTVSSLLANSLGRCANIDVDYIKHFTEFGFDRDDVAGDYVPYNEWRLVGEATTQLTKLYLDKHCSVIINGYLDESAWDEIRKVITPVHKFLLLPSLETLKQRDAMRSEETRQGERASERHFGYFSKASYFNDFDIINTSDQSPEETVIALKAKIGLA